MNRNSTKCSRNAWHFCMLFAATLLFPLTFQAQTVLINPAAEGGFELGDGSFAANGWSLDNDGAANQWYTGTVPPGFTNRSAYVSNDGGVTWAYTNSSASVVHFWRDVTFPAGETQITGSFIWQALGETSSYDALMISLAPTSYTPVGTTTSLGTAPLAAPAVTLVQLWNVGSVQNFSSDIPNSLIENCNNPVTLRVIFSWKNDTSLGTSPPAAIDDISLTSAVPPPPNPLPSAGPFTINNTLATGGTNFNNFTDAINWLNGATNCLGTGIVFNVSAGQLFNEDPPEITASGNAGATIIFQKAGMGANPVIRKLTPGTIASTTSLGSNGDGILVINGGDYITFDAIDLETDPAFSGSGYMEYGYYLKKATGADACKNVTIKNCNITLNKAAIYSFGVFVSNISGTATVTVSSTGGRSENIKIFNNNISNAYGGVQLRGYSSSSPYDFYDQNIEVGEEGGNTITNFGGGGSTTYGVYTIYQNNCKINNNTITGGNGTTTTHYGIFASTSSTSSYQINNNTIDLTNSSTTSQMTAIGTSLGTTISLTNIVEIDGNNITLSRPSATTGTTYIIYNSSTAPNMLKITNNTIHDCTIAGTGIIYCIYQASTPANALIEGNEISNITRQGTTSTSAFYGIYSSGSTTVLNTVISGNKIHDLTGMGTTGLVSGIYLASNFTANVYNNKIYNIVSDNASGVANGITIASGVVTGNFYNNLIGGIRAPNTGNSTAAAPSVRGINITSTTTNSSLLLAYNTINLDATSAGANFGTAGIFHTGNATATTVNLTLRNNIVVNNSTPAGTGLSVAFQRSTSSTANYNEASNNNLFYAGTPGASNLIYYDGTNSFQTLGDFKCFAAPREALSVTENPAFLSVSGASNDFLHLNPATPTQAESGAVNIAGIDEDYDAQVRQGNPGYAGTGTAPDIGADEGNFIASDMVGPAISYDLLSNSVCLTGPTLSAVITDASGVNTTAGTKPRLWYKKSTEANVLPATNTSADAGWKWVEASNSSSPFDFTLNYNLLTSAVAGGDVIEYFVVAQDLQSTPNVGTQTAVYFNCGVPASVALSAGLFPVSSTSTYTITAEPSTITATAAPDQVCVIDDVTLSISPSALGAEYQWESSPAGLNTWTAISGATTTTYEVTGVNTSTDYRCVITCGGVPITASPSTVATVMVSNPMVLSTTPGEECGPGPISVTLGATASAGATLNWYEAPTGGMTIGTGTIFNTPAISTTTTYYVAASEGGSTESAAKPTNISTENTSGNQWGLVFDVVNVEATISTVDIYSVAAAGGTISVELQDNTGTVLQTAGPFAFPIGSTGAPVLVTIPVNFTVPVGTAYRMVSAAMSGNLIRETGSNNSYPYVSPSGNIIVTSGYISGTSTTYYWFYNWQVSTGCESAREPVVATILNEQAACPDDFTVCLTASPFALEGATPADGTYSGAGVSNGIFDPVAAGAGPHIITYTYCNTSCEFTITVGDPVITIDVTETSGISDDDGVICTGASATLTATAGVSYSWDTGAGTQAITVSPTTTTTYSVTVTDGNGCTGVASMQIVVNPLPNATIDPASASICSNTGEEVTLTASGGVSYLWNTDQNTASITVSPATTTTYTVDVTDSNGCVASASATVTVNDPPVIAAVLTEPTTCISSNGAINLTLTGSSPYTFEWATPNGSGLVPGQEDQTTLGVGTYFLTVTDVNGCISTDVFTLIGPGGCEVCPTMGTLTTDPADGVCDGSNFTLNLTGMTNMGVTYGVHFKYSVSPLADPYTGGTTIAIVPNTGLANFGSEASAVASLPAGTYYLYAILDPLPNDPTCRPSVTTNFFVNPVPVMNPVSSQVVCNNSGTTPVNFSSNVTGSVYSWANTNTSIGLAASGTGNIPSFVAVNNGTAPVVATISVVASYTFGGVTCTGNPVSFTITVNPTPTVADPADQVICAGSSTSVTFSGTVAGTVFNWTNNNTSIGLGSSGTGNIPVFTATNTSGVTQVATLVVTPSYTNGGVTCSGASQTFTITVNPLPTMNTPANQELCGGNATQAVNFTSSVPGTTYSWTNNNTTIGLAASGTGNIPSFTAVNNSGVVQVATITATPSFTSAGITCSGAPVSFTITVQPPATVNVGADQTICENQSASLTATLGGTATGGTWSGGAGTFGNATALSTTYTPAASEYGSTVTLTFTTNDPAGPCTAASDAMLLTINTLPVVFAGPDTKICEGDNLDLTTLGATINDNGSGVTSGTWSTSGSGTFQPNNQFPPGATSYVPSAADLATGFVTLKLTSADPSGPCSAVQDAFLLQFKGEEPIACNDTIQVSLDGDGVSEVLPDMILEGTYDYEFFVVALYNGINYVGNTVDCGDIGTILTVKVTDICTGSYCWGHVKTEDKWAPDLLCNEVNINCSVDYNTVPFPIATDNCDNNPDVQLVDQSILDDELCTEDQVIVLRNFIATDNYGNQSTVCTQVITINRPNSVDFPDDIQWECSVYNQYPNVIGATPITGNNATTGSGIPGNIDGEYCMYAYSHSDQTLPACGTSFKVVRTWTVLDWCTGQVVTSNNQGEDNIQIIVVMDTTPPVITLASYTVSANIPAVHPQPCASTGYLQPANITDNCNSWTVRIFTPVGEANYFNGTDGAAGGFIPAPGLPIGTHLIHYQAEDACNNVADLYVTVQVIDNVAPAAICDEITEANLSSDGLATVYAETFDDGSHDNCCLDHFEARRMNGDCNGNYDDFGPTVTFCCSDAGTAVIVVFRAFDCYGNFNDCMVTVNVNDKLPPSLISCPPGQTITCDQYLDNYAAGLEQGDYSVLAGFNFPTFYDNCDYDEQYTVTVNLNTCSEGTITRNWTASDANGQATCTQTITVNHVSDWVVEFPADFTGQCVNGQLPDTGEPKIFHDECELIGVSHSDQPFTVVPDACYKIVRTWNVINWCIYDDFGYNAYSEAGKAECNLNQDWDGDGDKDCRTFRDGYNSTGSPGTPDGFITYKQTIKVIDNEAPVFTVPPIDGCITDTDCNTDLVLPYPDITDDCSLANEVTITGDFGTFANITGDVTVPNVGVGEYEVIYSVTDNCGNTGYETVTVVVEDCKKPTPLCDNGLVVEIMQTGMVEVFASAFDEGSFDNCGPIVSFTYSPDVNDVSTIFTCDDLGQQPVQIWVTDIYGNQDYCETYLVVQDNMNFCGGGVPVVVAGAIATEGQAGVAGVDVQVNGGLLSQLTNQTGDYSFSLFAGGDYSITPILDANPSNGVTTWDLVLISRHILGIQLLDSPYKLIAADANKSNTVTTLDMVNIRKVILQLEPSFPNNTSWRFVDKDFLFPNPANPFGVTFPEVINYNNLSANDLNADFVAIKVGDVNGSAVTSLNGDVEDRTFNGSMHINVQDQQLKAGKTYMVDFTAEAVDLLGYQFTLNYNTEAIGILDLLDGVAGAENFGMLLDEGVLTTSWNGSEARALAQGEVLFSLVVKANADVSLSEAFGIGSAYTVAEAYGSNSELLDVKLLFQGMDATAFALFQNIPNPFNGVTVIGFTLPEATTATLKVMDVSGQVLQVLKGDYAKGYNEIRLGLGQTSFAPTGVLFYQLDTPTHSATRKMIIAQ